VHQMKGNPHNLKSVEEWDHFLFKYYGYGLYPFCRVLAKILLESDPRYYARPNDLPSIMDKARPAQYKRIRERIQRNENLIKKIFEVLTKNLSEHGILKNGNSAEEYIKNIYTGVDLLVKDIEEENDSDKTILANKSLWIKKGHPTDTRNKIAFAFAQVIKNENDEPEWSTINLLLVWLWERIHKASYSKELALVFPVFSKVTLRSAYYKFIKNPVRKSDIEALIARCFSPSSLRKAAMIHFHNTLITIDYADPKNIESRYPTVVFPDRRKLKGMFDQAGAISFLGKYLSEPGRMAGEELVPHRMIGYNKAVGYSRTELQQWLNINKTVPKPIGKKVS